MQGFVSHEKQKFERLAQEMKSKEKDLLVKNETLKRVEALIKNSPVVRNKKPLQENNTTKNETVNKLYLALILCIGVQNMYCMYAVPYTHVNIEDTLVYTVCIEDLCAIYYPFREEEMCYL